MQIISGFSKLSKDEKINWLMEQVPSSQTEINGIKTFWHTDSIVQKQFDEFSENTIGNFYLPFGLAPNFILNERVYTIPMVIEESSVVAAASKSAKFWASRGGFKTNIISTTKSGQVHFIFDGDHKNLETFFNKNKNNLLEQTKDISINMNKRGGGITALNLLDKTSELENYYQLDVKFETCDAMGANFINSILESLGNSLERFALDDKELIGPLDVTMCILSNYTPECLVEVSVECPIEDLGEIDGLSSSEFAKKFYQAIQIAKIDRTRAVTHNKGIFNGIDAVVIATGNDFRATSACAHAYAAKDGSYRSLSSCSIDNDIFKFTLTLPLAIGTVGGLTNLHPMAKLSLDILGRPSASELMGIIACAGLAQNFGAIRSLVTTGIQKGHMKMHLLNILNQLDATKEQIESAKIHFREKVISFSEVRNFLERKLH